MPYSKYDRDSDGSEDEIFVRQPEQRLSTNEYVVARINVRRTLGAQFYRLGMYYNIPGFFPIDSDEAVSESWRLVDEFLEQCNFPRNEDMPDWSCPRFVPQSHLMLVSKSYWSPGSLHLAELLPVVVAPFGTSLAECHFIEKQDLSAYAPIKSPFQQHDVPVLVTDPPLLQDRAVYQNADMNYYCTVGSIKDGPQIFLRPDSMKILQELDLKSREAYEALCMQGLPLPDYGLCTPCHCDARSEIAKRLCTATLGDIVVDFDRSAVNTIQLTEISSRALSFDEECHRVMALLDDWVEWIYTR